MKAVFSISGSYREEIGQNDFIKMVKSGVDFDNFKEVIEYLHKNITFDMDIEPLWDIDEYELDDYDLTYEEEEIIKQYKEINEPLEGQINISEIIENQSKEEKERHNAYVKK